MMFKKISSNAKEYAEWLVVVYNIFDQYKETPLTTMEIVVQHLKDTGIDEPKKHEIEHDLDEANIAISGFQRWKLIDVEHKRPERESGFFMLKELHASPNKNGRKVLKYGERRKQLYFTTKIVLSLIKNRYIPKIMGPIAVLTSVASMARFYAELPTLKAIIVAVIGAMVAALFAVIS